jgi:type I restriction enzyme S subunit
MSELPKGWLEIPVSAIAEVNPPQPSIPIPEDGQVSFVRMASVEAESGILDASQLRPWTEVNKGYTKFQEGDVLFAKITPCMENGKFAVARELHGQVGAGSTEFHVLRTYGLVREKYLLHFLLQRQVRRNARMLMQGAAGQLRIPASFFDRLILPLAPPDEQDRIVAEIEKQFTRLDAATAALKRVQANLKRYRASVLKAACEGRLVPTEAELARKEGRDYEPAEKLLQRILRERRARWEIDTLAKMQASGKPPQDDCWKQKYSEPAAPDPSFAFTPPEGWCIASMDQLTSRITSGSRDWSEYYGRGTGTFVMAQNVRPGLFDMSMRQEVDPPVNDPSAVRSQIEKNDLLVTIVGANTGDVCRVPDSFPEHYVCQSVALMRPVETSLGQYLEFFMSSDEHGQMIYKRYTYGAGRPHLSFEQLKATPVLLPPEAEITRIVDVVSQASPTVERQRAAVDLQLSKVSGLRNAILASAFTGQLVPQDPTDEPASALLERIRAERVESSKKTAARSVTRKRGQR